MTIPSDSPELVFGLVGPLGTDLTWIGETLKEALAQVRYRGEIFRLSRLMREIPRVPWSDLKDGHRDSEIESHMTAGNSLRKSTGRNDALAMLGIGAIREYRQSESDGDSNRPLRGHAHILHSLKRPEEVETLRRIYGPTFYVLSVYSPRSLRVKDLARRIAESHHSNQLSEYFPVAERLLARDEAEEGDPHGQDVQRTYPMADVIVDASDTKAAASEVYRFVELVFGNTFHTPSRVEEGMYLAHAASYRSASLARQVGAVICRADGTVVAIGANEVAAAGGGQYWCDSPADGRDFRIGYDSSTKMRENLLKDILHRLQTAGWLTSERREQPLTELIKEAHDGPEPIMKGAQFTATIDFIRAVHAEMAALTAASRHGVTVSGSTLFSTTFPCHDCAKHIVASGIRRVVYIEPYPKSLVEELYSDSIAVDTHDNCGDKVRFDPFVGIAPHRYRDLFALHKRKRKNPDGTVAVWRRTEAVPTLPDYLPSPLARLTAEQEEVAIFDSVLSRKGIRRETNQ